MNISVNHRSIRSVLTGAAAAIALTCTPACKPAAPQAAPAPKPKLAVSVTATNAATNQVDLSEFTSAFNDLLPPDKAKDPFFPSSTRRFKVIVPQQFTNVPPVHTEPIFLLKGISKGRFVIINNAELEMGEEQGVRTSTGRVAVKVLEIGDDYVIIKVAGEAAPKKLMLEHKK